MHNSNAQPMNAKRSHGFTIIELMIVVAIISVLSVIAIPAYMNYTARTMVSEGMLLFDGIKSSLTEYHHFHGYWPTASELGMNDGSDWGNYVNIIELGEAGGAGTGQVIIVFNPSTTPFPAGQNKLFFEPVDDGSTSQYLWNCVETSESINRTYWPRICL